MPYTSLSSPPLSFGDKQKPNENKGQGLPPIYESDEEPPGNEVMLYTAALLYASYLELNWLNFLKNRPNSKMSFLEFAHTSTLENEDANNFALFIKKNAALILDTNQIPDFTPILKTLQTGDSACRDFVQQIKRLRFNVKELTDAVLMETFLCIHSLEQSGVYDKDPLSKLPCISFLPNCKAKLPKELSFTQDDSSSEDLYVANTQILDSLDMGFNNSPTNLLYREELKLSVAEKAQTIPFLYSNYISDKYASQKSNEKFSQEQFEQFVNDYTYNADEQASFERYLQSNALNLLSNKNPAHRTTILNVSAYNSLTVDVQQILESPYKSLALMANKLFKRGKLSFKPLQEFLNIPAKLQCKNSKTEYTSQIVREPISLETLSHPSKENFDKIHLTSTLYQANPSTKISSSTNKKSKSDPSQYTLSFGSPQ